MAEQMDLQQNEMINVHKDTSLKTDEIMIKMTINRTKNIQYAKYVS